MSDKKEDRSTWAIGGGVLMGVGVGFLFFDRAAPAETAIPFVGCVIAGLGLGLIVTSILSSLKNRD